MAGPAHGAQVRTQIADGQRAIRTARQKLLGRDRAYPITLPEKLAVIEINRQRVVVQLRAQPLVLRRVALLRGLTRPGIGEALLGQSRCGSLCRARPHRE